MSERVYTTIDKTAWGEGPWADEPDKIQWVDEATNLDCLIVRHPRYGNLCGYVGVGPEHPLHGRQYDELDLEVHGDLSFSNSCMEGVPESEGVCHVPAPGRPADVWWLGFDCAHAFDLSPGLEALTRKLEEVDPDALLPRMPAGFGRDLVDEMTSYKPVAYVRAECASLAAQLRAREVAQ